MVCRLHSREIERIEPISLNRLSIASCLTLWVRGAVCRVLFNPMVSRMAPLRSCHLGFQSFSPIAWPPSSGSPPKLASSAFPYAVNVWENQHSDYQSGSSCCSSPLRVFFEAVYILRKNHPVLGRTCPDVPIYLDPVGIVESAPRDNADAWKLLETQHNSCCAPVAEVQPQPKIAFVGALFVCSKPIAR